MASMISSWLSSEVKILEHLRNSSACLLKCTIQFWEGSSSPREATHSVQGGEEEPEHVISGEDHGCIPVDGANMASMISSWLSSEGKILEHLRNSSACLLKCTIQFWEGSSSPREAAHSVQGTLGSRAKVSCHTTSPGFWCQVLRHAVFLAGR
ncbi:hypothetical protein DPMN_152043 [Dreissena polymorpha]|uniref:Uncharacterized protein n=1 Tax=Dreissena polymorpha TaxID=45954 RepID=A0A9D4FG54_DREPO|nr:hypothetical protein DPMN_152043 [Dreissena polymorpha]